MGVGVKFQRNLTSLRSLMIKFYFKIVYKQFVFVFVFVFESQKFCFPRFSM